MSKKSDSPLDEVAHVDYLEKLIREADELAVRLGIEELSESWSEFDLYDIEKKYRIRLEVIRRLIRRYNNWAEAYAKMVKTDADKIREQEHTKLTEYFMNKVGMSKIDAAAAASGVIVMRKLEEPEEEEPVN
ncbi:MAG TPA: hypothetical protein VF791_21760 [Pyrinomonadaceae bacterium]